MILETMSLKGGINLYKFPTRYESNISPMGRKVSFLNTNGYNSEREYANKLFQENEILTIKEIYVGGTSSEFEFLEYPNEKFNTVMFADVN